MTYFADLSKYKYTQSNSAMINIGWLDISHDFPKGNVSQHIYKILLELADLQSNIMRGVHDCQFCTGESPLRLPADNDRGYVSLGMGEIRIRASSGQIYAAPSLILHYIRQHHYLPPEEFLRAVEEFEKRKAQVMDVEEW